MRLVVCLGLCKLFIEISSLTLNIYFFGIYTCLGDLASCKVGYMLKIIRLYRYVKRCKGYQNKPDNAIAKKENKQTKKQTNK